MHKFLSALLLLLLLVFTGNATAQAPIPLPQFDQPVSISSGNHSAGENSGIAFSKVVSVPGAAWLQLEFGDYNLGDSSYIKITSLLDGAEQELDSNAMATWQGNTALFNGDAVRVDLVAAGSDSNVSMSISNVNVGEVPQVELTTQTICGNADNRVGSTQNGIGRLLGTGVCTGWLTSTGAVLTAGHCAASANSSGAVLQFNVPDSSSTGAINNPSPIDQYPVISSSIVNQSGSATLGNDWLIFEVGNNSSGQSAIARENYWFRTTRNYTASQLGTVRITGFGADGPAPGFGSTGTPRNSDTFTLQTHASSSSISETINNANSIYWNYRAESQGGNSGGPVLKSGTNTAVGIHTNGGCGNIGGYSNPFNLPSGTNKGVSFENTSLEVAMNDYYGTNTYFIDRAHPHRSSTTSGWSTMTPNSGFNTGFVNSPDNAQLRIVEGTYAEEGIYTEPKILLAPVGSVYINGNP